MRGKPLRRIALWEAKHPKTVIIAALLLLIPALLGFLGTKVNYDILSYLPDELESVQGEQVLDKTFNTAGISIVITENMQPKQTLALKNEILKVDGVSSVIWVDTIADIGIPADILARNSNRLTGSRVKNVVGGKHHMFFLCVL